MSVYTILSGVTVVQTIAANVRNVDGSNGGSNLSVQLTNPAGGLNPATYQGFQLVVKGIGTVSASAQIVGSNDGINWMTVGNVIVASGQNAASAGALGSTPFNYFSAYITAISGTNATATVTASA